MSKVKEMNINELIGNNDGNVYYKNKFIIPNYQRGYRWTKSEVEQLLDDIDHARKADLKKYCLQPIITLKRDEREVYGFCCGENR